MGAETISARKVSSKKQKGRLLQQWVAEKLLALNPSLEEDDIKSTSMGAAGEDVQLSPAARKLLPIQIECKRRVGFAIQKLYGQAETHGDNQPVLIIRGDRKRALAVVDAEHYLELISRDKE